MQECTLTTWRTIQALHKLVMREIVRWMRCNWFGEWSCKIRWKQLRWSMSEYLSWWSNSHYCGIIRLPLLDFVSISCFSLCIIRNWFLRGHWSSRSETCCCRTAIRWRWGSSTAGSTGRRSKMLKPLPNAVLAFEARLLNCTYLADVQSDFRSLGPSRTCQSWQQLSAISIFSSKWNWTRDWQINFLLLVAPGQM